MEVLLQLNTAQLAKEKGFDIPCEYFYRCYVDSDEPDLYHYEEVRGSGFAYLRENKEDFEYSAPTQSLLQKWLREVHNLRVFCTFETIDDSETAWVWNIVSDNEKGKGKKKDTWDFYDRITSFDEGRMRWYNEYEDALEDGLFEALKLIPQKTKK